MRQGVCQTPWRRETFVMPNDIPPDWWHILSSISQIASLLTRVYDLAKLAIERRAVAKPETVKPPKVKRRK